MVGLLGLIAASLPLPLKARLALSEAKRFRRHTQDRGIGSAGCTLTITAVAVERKDRRGGTFVTDNHVDSSAKFALKRLVEDTQGLYEMAV